MSSSTALQVSAADFALASLALALAIGAIVAARRNNNELHGWHAAASVVHAISFCVMVWQSAAADAAYLPHVYTVLSRWQKVGGGACTDADSQQCVVESSLSSGVDAPTFALLAAFFAISAAAEAYYASTSDGMAGYVRWLEYAASAALQFFVINVALGNTEAFSASQASAAVAQLQLAGYCIEHEMRERGEHLDARFCWRLLAAAFCALFAAWVPVTYHFARGIQRSGAGAPWFVYVIYCVSLLLFSAFGVVMASHLHATQRKRATQETRNKARKKAELQYTILSFISKAAVAYVYWGGGAMRMRSNIQSVVVAS